MDLARVMDEIAGKVRTVEGLGGRVSEWPASSVVAPAGIVTYPDKVEYDQTYGRGMDVFRGLEVLVVVGKANDRSARNRVAAYTAGDGPKSVKQAIETKPHVSFDDLQVIDADFDVVTIAGVDYIAAIFRMDIAGQGNA